VTRPTVAVYPDLGALAGSDVLVAVAGALLTFTLVVAVLMLIVCAIAWALAASHGNYPVAAKARTGLLVAVGGAVLAGAGVAWINWLLGVGARL
jgi:hypothetical protein